jgi:type I restriction enzyme S subunit
LARKGEIKKPRKLPGLAEMDLPFSVPDSWEWVQLEDISRDWGQKTPNKDFSYIDVASVDNLRGVTTEASVLPASDAPSRARKVVQQGTLIYSTVRPYLQNIAVIENKITPEPIASTAFAIVHPLASMPARFFLHYLRSLTFVEYVESVQTGIAYPAINDRQFFSGVIPIPPLEEQHRIVQKVDELMALCDRLEQQTSDQLEAHETLVDTLLGTLTQSENATELADSWARLAAHFDTLFTTEQSIDKLKQTILQLAVMGRLVEQEDGDESVNDYLERLVEESQSSRSKKAKLLKRGGEVSSEEQPFTIPSTWKFCRLGQIAEFENGDRSSRYPNSSDLVDEGVPFFGAKEIVDGKLQFTDELRFITPEKFDSLSNGKLRDNDFVILLRGMVGKLARFHAPEKYDTGFINAQMLIIRLSNPEVADYFQVVASSKMFKDAIAEKITGSAVKQMPASVLPQIIIPLPASAEQARIVQKVDELMALCDQLKERLNQTSETRCQLAGAVVEKALN